jgi:hypothetical protein
VQFLLGVVLFVVVIGALDARLPWPGRERKEGEYDCRTLWRQ